MCVYVYAHMCLCMCVCVCVHVQTSASVWFSKCNSGTMNVFMFVPVHSY